MKQETQEKGNSFTRTLLVTLAFSMITGMFRLNGSVTENGVFTIWQQVNSLLMVVVVVFVMIAFHAHRKEVKKNMVYHS